MIAFKIKLRDLTKNAQFKQQLNKLRIRQKKQLKRQLFIRQTIRRFNIGSNTLVGLYNRRQHNIEKVANEQYKTFVRSLYERRYRFHSTLDGLSTMRLKSQSFSRRFKFFE